MKGVRRTSASLVLLGALALSGTAGAQIYGPTSTLSDISWSIQSTVYPFTPYCVEMRLDATANWTLSPSRFFAYGSLFCPGFLGDPGFTAYGAGYGKYVAGKGDVVDFAIDVYNHKISCENLPVPGLSGTCNVYYNGNKVGTAEIVRK